MQKTARKRSPWTFFLLVTLFSIPGYVIGLVPPYTLVMVVYPLLAASLLTYREAGSEGVKRLLGRAFDYRRIQQKIWYVPILLLMPAVMLLEYGCLRLMGVPIPGLQVPFLLLPVYFVVFFVAGIGEEIGWSGYALDPMQDRWGALAAGIAIGMIWALWHLVPYLLANPLTWVAGQFATTVILRVLMVWIYNNTGKSVFGMILFHAMINMATIPDYGFRYDPVLASAILAVTAIVVVFLWGQKTLARYRYAEAESSIGS